MRGRHARLAFTAVAGVALCVLAADRYVHRPVPIPAPSSADSLAGVVARLLGGDSASVARIRWYVVDRPVLRWAKSDEYAYRNLPSGQLVPIGAEVDVSRWTVTFAKGQVTPANTKHELAHLLLRTPQHPAAVFHRVEAYRGR